MELPAPLTRQIGPLPAWGWGVVGVGGFLAYRFLTGGGNTVTVGDLNGGALGDAVDDIDSGGAGTGDDGDGGVVVPPGIIQPPIPVPGTPGGNGRAGTILTLKKPLPFQNPKNIGHVAGELKGGAFAVEHVKLGGEWYYRILGRVGPNNVITASSRRGMIIRDRPELRKLFTITHTPATQAA